MGNGQLLSQVLLPQKGLWEVVLLWPGWTCPGVYVVRSCGRDADDRGCSIQLLWVPWLVRKYKKVMRNDIVRLLVITHGGVGRLQRCSLRRLVREVGRPKHF